MFPLVYIVEERLKVKCYGGYRLKHKQGVSNDINGVRLLNDWPHNCPNHWPKHLNSLHLATSLAIKQLAWSFNVCHQRECVSVLMLRKVSIVFLRLMI